MEEEDHYWKKRKSWHTTSTSLTTTAILTSSRTLTSASIKTASRIIKKISSASWLAMILILIITNGPILGSTEGNVGCHFEKSLCLEKVEFCYDDFAFGKCLSKSGVEEEDLERIPLTEEQSHILATMLEEMQGAGLGWDHPFVQCRIQGTLFSMRKNIPLPQNLCVNLAPDPEVIDPQSPLAFVRFTPPNEDYADEVYYPPFIKKGFDERFYLESQPLLLPSQSFSSLPIAQQQHQQHQQHQQNQESPIFSHHNQNNVKQYVDKLDEYYASLLNNERRQIEKEKEIEQILNQKENNRNSIDLGQILAAEYNNNREKSKSPIYLSNEFYPQLIPYSELKPVEQINHLSNAYKRAEIPYRNNNKDMTEIEEFENGQKINNEDNEIPSSTFFREMSNINPENEYVNYYRNNPFDAIIPSSINQPSENVGEDDAIEDKYFAMNTYPIYSNHHKYPNKKILSGESSGVYTEGGLVYVPERNNNEDQQTNYDREEQTRNLLENMLGFTRHERLDVKKPGPLIGPPPSSQQEHVKIKNNTAQVKDNAGNKGETKEVIPMHIKENQMKKATKDHSDDSHAPHSVDTEYAHVYLKNRLDNWQDGLRIVTALGDILNMQPYFTKIRVDPHEVTFRVEPNPEKKTASDVAKVINDPRTKSNLSRRLGVIVLQAGVGDKIKSDSDSVSASKLELAEEGPDVTHIMAYMFAGAGAAAVVVIVITLLLIRRHDQKRDKLGGLQSGLTGAESCSKDYQELCRARMAGKGTTETLPGGRITSLSKENDRPPSSRSSTSSWSEEPVLTNMDISTGHMVLSYMEDHLRNKGRLQREWEALCRYEAEPSAREAALQEQCATLNRQDAPLPYDHSRVVLNHLANAEGLDYINASTITDHDPRAPAYVAAQGPLPTTLAHFWQMIWEQGAVIIVALCRLQENGEIACARYWPEEGAEVYHIYEVHLVSEHIWCDDYLVRSFYLKNLRTSETRTVTQFHFLSWPQGGVPSSAKALLEFRRKVNKSYRGRSCPIVVHGSHGAGRTGAYILLDLVLGRMNKGAREIDIAATLEHLRDQRAGLVSTRQQFEFVLMAVAEEVHAILKALPTNTQSVEKRELDKEPPLKEEETKLDNNNSSSEQITINNKKQVKTATVAKTTETKPSVSNSEKNEKLKNENK